MKVCDLRVPTIALLTILFMQGAHADWDAKHLKMIRGAATTLRQAIATVERELKGKAFAAETAASDEAIVYTVKVLTGDKAMSATVDAKTGKMTASAVATGESAAQLKEFTKIKGTLLAAIRAAETTAKGKAFEAGFKHGGGKSLFEVDAAGRDDVEKDVVIDAISGKIRKVTEKSAEAAGSGASAQVPAVQPTP